MSSLQMANTTTIKQLQRTGIYVIKIFSSIIPLPKAQIFVLGS